MRNAVIEELAELARDDPRVILLTADLGFGVLDDFARKLPDQFVNVGVAEQAMIGVATGFAEAGFIPYCYSIATFAFLRPFEFIRNGPIAHNLPVRVIGVGAGVDYSYDGLTHYAVEDLALARSQPGFTVYTPATDDDARQLVREAHALRGPAYLRLSRTGARGPSNDVRTETPTDTDVLVLATGATLDRAVSVARFLSENDVSVNVLSVLRFAASTGADIDAHVRRAHVCLTVEDHYEVGGLGSAVADVIASSGLAVPLLKDAITALPVGTVGSATFLQAKLRRPVEEVGADVLQRLARTGAQP